MKIHANQAPAISFSYVFNKWQGLDLHGFACEGSVRLNGLSSVLNAHAYMLVCLFVCLFVVCLSVHTFV